MHNASTGKGYVITRLLLQSSPLVIAVGLYGYTITLPFFLDDGAHFTLLAGARPFAFWGEFPAFPFYRPVAFTVWQGYEMLFGRYDPVALHFLNVACFGMSGVLVGQIARRLLPVASGWTLPLLAGGLFVLFPFAYQAVAMVAALFHLTLIVGITASIWLALLWLDGHGGGWTLIVSWFMAFVAVFSHETGVLIVPFMAGALWMAARGRNMSLRRIMIPVLPVMIIAGTYLLLWWSFRPQDAGGLSQDGLTSVAVLVQGLVYPLARIVRLFVDGDITPVVLVAMSGGVLALITVLCYPRYRSVLLYGMFWFVVGIVPAALLLDAGYVLGQPRLALLAWGGGALLWAAFIDGLWRHSAWLRRGLALLLVSGFVMVSLDFLSMRRADFLKLRDYQVELLDIVNLGNVSEQIALVNAPDFLTPSDANRRFLLGTEGVLFVDPAADYDLQLAINTGDSALPLVRTLAYLDTLRAEDYGFFPHPPVLSREGVAEAVRLTDHVVVTQFDGDAFWPEYTGGRAAELPDSEPLAVQYGNEMMRLTGAVATYAPDMRRVFVHTRWQVDEAGPVKLFAHVYCDGMFLAQSDGYPWGDTFPFVAWEPGESYVDQRSIRLDAVVEPACLRVEIGVYNENNGERLTASNAVTATPLTQNAYVVTVEATGD